MTYTEAYGDALTRHSGCAFITVDPDGGDWVVRVYERDSRSDYELIAKYKVPKNEDAFA